MAETEIKHMHEDIEEIKRNISVIKHILSEEQELSSWAKNELKKARKAPKSDYLNHEYIKKRLLK